MKSGVVPNTLNGAAREAGDIDEQAEPSEQAKRGNLYRNRASLLSLPAVAGESTPELTSSIG
jgi:hypothetical protein